MRGTNAAGKRVGQRPYIARISARARALRTRTSCTRVYYGCDGLTRRGAAALAHSLADVDGALRSRTSSEVTHRLRAPRRM